MFAPAAADNQNLHGAKLPISIDPHWFLLLL